MSRESFDYRGYMTSLGYAEEELPEEFTDEEKDEIYFGALQGAIKEYKEREKQLSPFSDSKEQNTRAMQRFLADNPDTRQDFGIPEEITDKEEPYNLENFGRYIQRKFPGETNLNEPAQNYVKSYFDEEIFNDFLPYVRPFMQGQNKEEVHKHFMEANSIDKDTTVNEILQKTFRKGETQPWVAGEKLPEGRDSIWQNFRGGATGSVDRALGSLQKTIGDALGIPSLSLSGLGNIRQGEVANYNYNAKFREKEGIIDTWNKYEDDGFFKRIGHTVYSATERAAASAAPTLTILGAEVLGRTVAGSLAGGGAGAVAGAATGIGTTVSKLTKIWNGIKAVAPAAKYSGLGASAFYMLGEPMMQAMEDGVYTRDYADKAVIFGMLATGSEYLGIMALRGGSATMKLANKAVGKKLGETKAFEYVFGRTPEPGEIATVKILGRQWAARHGVGTLWETAEESATEYFQDWLSKSFSQSLGAEYKEGEISKDSWEAALTAIPTTLALRGLGGIKSYRDYRRFNKRIEERREKIEETGGIGSGVADKNDLSNFSAKAIESGQVRQDEIYQAGKDTIFLSYGGDTGFGETKSQAAQNLLYARNARSLGSIDAETIETEENNPNVASVAYGPEGKKVTYISQDGNAREKLKELVDDHNAADSPFLLSEGVTIEEFKEGDKTRYYVTFPDDPIFNDPAHGGVEIDVNGRRRIVDNLDSSPALDRLYSRIDLHIVPVDVASEIADVQLPREYGSLDDAGLKNINKNFQLLSKGEGKLVFMDMKNRLVYSISEVQKKENTTDQGSKVKVTVSTPQGRVLSLDGKVREQTLVDRAGNSVSDVVNLSGIKAGIRAQERTVSGKTEYYFDVGEFEKRGKSFGLQVNRDPKNGSNQHRIVAKTASGRSLTIDVNEVTGELLVNYQGQSLQVGKAFEISDLGNRSDKEKKSPTYAMTMTGEYKYEESSPDGKYSHFSVKNGNYITHFIIRNSDGKITQVLGSEKVGGDTETTPKKQTKPTYTVDNLIAKFPENSGQIQRGYAIVKGDTQLRFLTSTPPFVNVFDNFTDEIEDANIIFEEDLETYAELIDSSQEPGLRGARLQRVLFIRDKNLDRKIAVLFSGMVEDNTELNEQLQGKESILNSLISSSDVVENSNLMQSEQLVDAFNADMGTILIQEDNFDISFEEEFGDEAFDALTEDFGEQEPGAALDEEKGKKKTKEDGTILFSSFAEKESGEILANEGSPQEAVEEIAIDSSPDQLPVGDRRRRELKEQIERWKELYSAYQDAKANRRMTARGTSERDAAQALEDSAKKALDEFVASPKTAAKLKYRIDEVTYLWALKKFAKNIGLGNDVEIFVGARLYGKRGDEKVWIKSANFRGEEFEFTLGDESEAKLFQRNWAHYQAISNKTWRQHYAQKLGFTDLETDFAYIVRFNGNTKYYKYKRGVTTGGYMEPEEMWNEIRGNVKEIRRELIIKNLRTQLASLADTGIRGDFGYFSKVYNRDEAWKNDKKKQISEQIGKEIDFSKGLIKDSLTEEQKNKIPAREQNETDIDYRVRVANILGVSDVSVDDGFAFYDLTEEEWRQVYNIIANSFDTFNPLNMMSNAEYNRAGTIEPSGLARYGSAQMEVEKQKLQQFVDNMSTALNLGENEKFRVDVGLRDRTNQDPYYTFRIVYEVKDRKGRDNVIYETDYNFNANATLENGKKVALKVFLNKMQDNLQAASSNPNHRLEIVEERGGQWRIVYYNPGGESEGRTIASRTRSGDINNIIEDIRNYFSSQNIISQVADSRSARIANWKQALRGTPFNIEMEYDGNTPIGLRIVAKAPEVDMSEQYGNVKKRVINNSPFISENEVYTLRIQGTTNHFGNPFSHRGDTSALIQVKDIATAVEYYKLWIKEGNETVINKMRENGDESAIRMMNTNRKLLLSQLGFIRGNLKNLIGKKLVYYNAGEQQYRDGDKKKVIYSIAHPNHAHILSELVKEEADNNINATQFGITENYTLNVYNGSNDNVDLSNFANRPIRTNINGKEVTFQTPEAYYHYQKLEYLDDTKIPKGYTVESWKEYVFNNLINNIGVKNLGNRLNGMVNEKWNNVKATKLEEAMLLSFEQNENAAKRLLATGNAKFSHLARNKNNPRTGWSQDVFPQILEQIRSDLREQHPDWAREASNRALDDFVPEIEQRIQNILKQFKVANLTPSVDFESQVNAEIQRQSGEEQQEQRQRVSNDPVLEAFGIREIGNSPNENNLLSSITRSVIPYDLFDAYKGRIQAGFVFYNINQDFEKTSNALIVKSGLFRFNTPNSGDPRNILAGEYVEGRLDSTLLINITDENNKNIIANAKNAIPAFRLISRTGKPVITFTDYNSFLTALRNLYEAEKRGWSTRKTVGVLSRSDLRALIAQRDRSGVSASVRFVDTGVPRFNETTSMSAPEGPRAKTVEQELNETYGEALVTSLMGTGMLRILPDQAAATELFSSLRGEPVLSINGKFQGFCDANGVVYLVEDGIRDGDVHRVMVHERGVHAGFMGFTKSEKFMQVLNYLRDHAGDNTDEGHAIQDALGRLPSWTRPSEKWMEVLAYICENRVDQAPNIVQRFVAAVKKWLFEHGFISVERFSLDDFVTLAQAAVRAELRHTDIMRENLYASNYHDRPMSRKEKNRKLLAIQMIKNASEWNQDINQQIKDATGWEISNGRLVMAEKDGIISNFVFSEMMNYYHQGDTKIVKLEDIYDNESLYRRYPELRYLSVRFNADQKNIISMSYYPEGRHDFVGINIPFGRLKRIEDFYNSGGKFEFLESLIHEIQHRIQDIHGWPSGVSFTELEDYFGGFRTKSQFLEWIENVKEKEIDKYRTALKINLLSYYRIYTKESNIKGREGDLIKMLNERKNINYPLKIIATFDKNFHKWILNNIRAKEYFTIDEYMLPGFPQESLDGKHVSIYTDTLSIILANIKNIENLERLVKNFTGKWTITKNNPITKKWKFLYANVAGEKQARIASQTFNRKRINKEVGSLAFDEYADKNFSGEVTIYMEHIRDIIIDNPTPFVNIQQEYYNIQQEYYTDEHARIFEVEKSDFEISMQRELAQITDTENLKSPNGESSKLSIRDYALVRTSEFKEKYGNWEKEETDLILDFVTGEPNLDASGVYQDDLTRARNERRSEMVSSYGTLVAEGVYIKGKNITVDFSETDRLDGEIYAKAKVNAAKYRERGDYTALENSIAALESVYPELYDTIELEGGGISGFVSAIMKTEAVYLGDPTLDAIVRDLKIFMHKVYKDMNGEYENAVDPSIMKAIADGIAGKEYQSLESLSRNPEETRNMYINQDVLNAAYPVMPQKSLLDGVQEDIQNLLNDIASGYTYEISPDGEPVIVDANGERTILQGVSPAHVAGVIEHILLKERVSEYNAPSDREQENPMFYSSLIEENKDNLPADYRTRQAVIDEVLVNKILAAIPEHIRARIRIHRDKNNPDTQRLLIKNNSNGVFIPFTNNAQSIHLRAFNISVEDFIKSLSEEIGHYSWQLISTRELMAVIEPLYSILESRIESSIKNYVVKLKQKNNTLNTFNKMVLLDEFFTKNQVSILQSSEAEIAQWCNSIFGEKNTKVGTPEEEQEAEKIKNRIKNGTEQVLKAREVFAQQIENIAIDLDTALFDVKAKDRKQRMDNFFKSMLTAIMAPASGKSVVISLPGLSGDTVRIQVNDWGQIRKVYPKSVEASIRQKIEKLCEGKSDRVKNFLVWRYNNLPHNPPLPEFLVNSLAKMIRFATGEKLENAKEWIRLPGGFVGDTIVGKDITIMLSRAFQAITSDYGLHLRKRYIDNTRFSNYLLKNNLNPDAVDKSKGYVIFMNEHGLDDPKMLELAQEFDMFLREGVSRIEDNVVKIRQEFLRTIDSIRNYGKSKGLEQSVVENMVKQIQDTMARFETDYTHRSYRAYTLEGRDDIIEMQKYLYETDPMNFLLTKRATAQKKIDEEREKWKPTDGSPSRQTEAQYRKNIKDAEHIIELADRMQALRDYAVGKVNEEDEKRRTSQGKEGAKLIDVDDYVFVNGTFEQRVFNVMKSTLNKLLDKNTEKKHNKGDKEHSRFTAVAGAMKKKLDDTNEVERAYIKFLKPITNPLESLLLSLDQQEKVINKIAFNRLLGEKILDYGMGEFKKEFDVTVSQGMTNIGFKENGTFLYFLQLSDFFQKRFEEEYEVASAFAKDTVLDKYFGLVRANLTVYNPKLMVNNYISNISVAAATGHLFRFGNYMKAAPAIRDSWMKQIFGGETKDAAVKRLLEEIQEHQVIGGSASSTEMRVFARGQHEQFLDFALGALEKAHILSRNGRFNINNFVSNILEKAREIYGYGDEWVKILAYLNNRDVATAKYEAQLDPDDQNYAEKVRRAAAKDAANLTQLETTTWELSPMMIRQLAKSGIRVLTPDFIMHNFQIARMMAVGLGRYREVWNEMGKLRAIQNRTSQQERYLELLAGEFTRRTAGLALGSSAMIGLAAGPIYIFPYLLSSLLPHLFFGGDDNDDENRRHLTPAEYRGAQMLLNSTMEFDNMWTPIYRTGKYTFVATNYQRQNAGETLFAPRRPTEDDWSLTAWGIDTARMLMNPDADNILGQIYNGLRGKDRYGQQVGYWRSLGELAVRGVVPQAGEQAIFTGTALASWAQGGDLRGRTAADLVAGRPATQHLAHKAWEMAGAGFREYDVRDLTSSQAYRMKQGIGNAQNPTRRDFIQSVINNPGMSDSKMVSEIKDMMASNRERLGKAGYAVTGARYWGLTEKELATYLNKGRNAPSTSILSQADSDKIRFGENIFDQHIIQSLKEQRKNFAEKMRGDSKYSPEQRKEIVDTIDRFIAKYNEMMGENSYVPEKSKSSKRKEIRIPTGRNEYDRNIYQTGAQGGNVTLRRVVDGDTYELQGSRGNVYRVRLAGIDSPEMGQDGFGMAARDRARELFANATKIDREILYADQHGRPVSKVTLTMQDGTKLDMGEELVKSGNAFVYDQYSHDPNYLAQIKAAEKNARSRGAGVYGEGNAQQPWEYRAQNR